MFALDIVLLILIIAVGVFLAGWLTPFAIVFINRLLVVDMDPVVILCICVMAALLGDSLLRFFDTYVHDWLEHKLNIRRKKHPFKHKRGVIRRMSHNLWESMQMITNKKILFLAVSIASFSVIPDFFVVDYSRGRMRYSRFVLAMSFGKFMTYVPLVWGSIGFLELIRNII